MVSYVRFCDDLDIVFNLPVYMPFMQDHEKEPTLRPTEFDFTVTYTKKNE
jgi:hypothetical protein